VEVPEIGEPASRYSSTPVLGKPFLVERIQRVADVFKLIPVISASSSSLYSSLPGPLEKFYPSSPIMRSR